MTQLLAEWESPYQNSVNLKNHLEAERTASVTKIRAPSLLPPSVSTEVCPLYGEGYIHTWAEIIIELGSLV